MSLTDSTPLGRTFTGTDRFRPLAFVGRGSMGVVYRVHDQETGTDVALKTLAVRDPGELYRLKNEFRSLAGVVHRNLVELYELFVDERECFFTMEFVDGVNFVEHVRRGTGGVDYERLTAVLRQLVSGLAAIHAEGKLHRDVKPSNVLIARNGRVVVLDFGLVTVLGGARAGDTQPGLVGTLTYMAPEQAWGTEPNPAADWYGVGVMLYEALTGRVPFDGPAARVLADKGRGKPPAARTVVPDVPADLDALAVALLEPEPARRPGPEDILDRLELRSPSTRHSRPVRHVSSEAVDAPFIGRVEEMAQLQRAFDSLAKRQTAVVLVEGSSGIGKSELVRRFLRSLESDDRTVLLDGRCHPYEAVPYKALDSLVDRLSRFLLTLPEFSVGALVPRHAATLTRLFPVLARVPALASWQDREDTAEPYEVRRRGFTALRELLARIGDRQPLVLWIDDLQWGDTDSAVLLRELLLPPDPPVMLLVLSYRSEDRDSAPLADTLKVCVGDLPAEVVHRIVLSPLSTAETHDLAAQLSRTSAPGRLAAIAAEAHGSPFLVTQLARYTAVQPLIEDEGARPTPLHLQTLLAERVDHLGASAQEILELVSIAGRPLDRSVALEAAGIGESGRPFISRLEHDGLLRTAPREAQPTVEIYHDRIREVIVAQLPQQRLRTRHRQLAETIERQPAPDPDALYRHYLGADERERAGEWAVRAADRAADTLAFVKAAEFYRAARELNPRDVAWRRGLLTREGDALVNAARFAEGAQAFLAAAAGADRLEALELRRRAAEHLIAGGSVDQGVVRLSEVIREVGLTYPRTPNRAMVSVAGNLLRLSVRRLRPRAVSQPVGAEELIRIDTCYSAGKNLVNADSIRGVYFSVQALLRALNSGDPIRLGRSLSIVGGSISAMSGPLLGRLGSRMMQLAEDIAGGIDSPLLRGTIDVATGQVFMMCGRWREALERSDVGVQLLTERCRGVAFECLNGRAMAQRALEELGDIAALERRARKSLEDAVATGDIFAEFAASQHLAFALTARHDLPAARALTKKGQQLWTQQGFHLQHLYAIRQEAYCDLYEGQPEGSYERLEQEWATLKRSRLLQVSLPRIDALSVRGRLALAVAAKSPGRRAELLNHADKQARLLAKEARSDATVHALLLQAGSAALRGQREAALGLLDGVAEAAREPAMALYAATALYRKGELLGGDAGPAVTEQACATMRTRGVAAPGRWAALYAPGFV